MRNFTQRSDKFVFSVIMILFASTIWISSVSALPQQQTSLGVKITDPAKGQQVAIGKNLILSGTSSYNATSNCAVFVVVDGVRPYQKTIPTGQAGGNDYSKWKYTFTPAYAGTIREGINRITAKLLCQANPSNLTKPNIVLLHHKFRNYQLKGITYSFMLQKQAGPFKYRTAKNDRLMAVT
jgi:hypothetical protein